MFKKLLSEGIRLQLRFLRAKILSAGLSKAKLFDQPQKEIDASKYMSVVVPICDAKEAADRCLKSLRLYGASAEIILVDDGSKELETIAMLRSATKQYGWKHVRHETSFGHSMACKVGAELATRSYLCLLNSDTIITPWCWAAAKDAFDADPRIAVVGPSTSWASTQQRIPRAEKCRHFWNDKQIFAFAENYVSKQPSGSWMDVDMVAGFAFFIRRNIWLQFGGFNKKLKDYGNEAELCKRIKLAGLRIIWTKNSYVHHLGEQSYKRLGKTEILRRRHDAKSYIEDFYAE